MTTSIATHILDGMRQSGIRQLFCLPGVQNDDFFDAVVDARDWLEVIVTRHEQGCAYLAMGAAMATGRPTAMCVVPGPGVLNAAAGLSSACGGGARVLAITGQVATRVLGRGIRVLHELDDQPAVLAQVTKHVAVIRDVDSAVDQIQAALDALVSGTPRPVAIEVPQDLWGKPAPGSMRAGITTMPAVDIAAVDHVADLLRKAERPLIWVGTGAQDCASAVRELADRLQAPVSTRRMGHGVMDERDPLFVPLGLAHGLWADRDLVVGIGSRIEFPMTMWGTGGLNLVQINTDAAELDRHGIGAVGIYGDAAEVVPLLNARLADVKRPDQRAHFATLRNRFYADIAFLEPQLSYLAVLSDVLPADAIIVEDVTQMTFVAHFAYQFHQPRTFQSTGFAGTLGAGVAQAIGAKAGVPNRAVVGIVGDGGFLFTATELATAAQHGIAVCIIVFNDSAYGNVKRIQSERYGPERTIASTLQNPDIVAFARSFGCYSDRVDSPEGLRDALPTALAHPGPSVIEVTMPVVPSPWPFIVMPKVR